MIWIWNPWLRQPIMRKLSLFLGEMLVGAAKALFMNEKSTGLYSSTTYQIVHSIRQSIRILRGTAVISLLQPAPETYDFFDDIILISDGQVVYHGPRDYVLEFHEAMGFRWPERKGNRNSNLSSSGMLAIVINPLAFFLKGSIRYKRCDRCGWFLCSQRV